MSYEPIGHGLDEYRTTTRLALDTKYAELRNLGSSDDEDEDEDAAG